MTHQEFSRKGGMAKTRKKRMSSRRNAQKAREALAKKRKQNDT